MLRPPLTIITAAESRYFSRLQTLLWTVSVFEPQSKVIVWDLGLTQEQLDLLNNIPTFCLPNWEIRKFDYSRYPSYFDINVQNGRMAFRPVTLQSAANEFGGLLLWLDASMQLRGSMSKIMLRAKQQGFYAPCTALTIERGLFPSSRGPLNVTDDLLSKNVMDAGMLCVDTTNPDIKAIIDRWVTVTMDANCTAPTGSAKRTHSQDGVFSAVMYQAIKAKGWTPDCSYAIELRKDRSLTSRYMIRHQMGMPEPKIPKGVGRFPGI